MMAQNPQVWYKDWIDAPWHPESIQPIDSNMVPCSGTKMNNWVALGSNTDFGPQHSSWLHQDHRPKHGSCQQHELWTSAWPQADQLWQVWKKAVVDGGTCSCPVGSAGWCAAVSWSLHRLSPQTNCLATGHRMTLALSMDRISEMKNGSFPGLNLLEISPRSIIHQEAIPVYQWTVMLPQAVMNPKDHVGICGQGSF